MAKQTNLRNVYLSALAREEFLGSNLKGMTYSTGAGRLPERYYNALHTAERHDDFFVVYSYATPIAWYADGMWTVPKVQYSVSTSRQLSALKLYTLPEDEVQYI